MAGFSQSESLSGSGYEEGRNYTAPLIIVTTLFFMWGMMSHLNGSLSPYLQKLFNLNDFQTSLIQFCFFGAYFVMSFPSSFVINKVGYKAGIVIGLITCAIGCFLFYEAANLRMYGVFLTALFTLASGITMLQVGANAYVSILGKPELSSSRLNLSQAFNSLGGAVAPLIGSYFILKNIELLAPAQQAEQVQTPYLVFVGLFLLLASFIYFSYLPPIKFESSTNTKSIWKFRHTVLGAIGILTYVGAEVAVETFLVKFISREDIGNMSASLAARYTFVFYISMMIGRFIGSWLMIKVSPGKILGTLGAGAVGLTLLAIVSSGPIAMWSILLVGICNSIMFPTIFTLGIKELGNYTAQGAALLIQAIVGGALIPPIMGKVSDLTGSLQFSFIVPAICYVFITYYGFIGSKVAPSEPHEPNVKKDPVVVPV
jgi:MFS transporter, FHS family, L-fucose permease